MRPTLVIAGVAMAATAGCATPVRSGVVAGQPASNLSATQSSSALGVDPQVERRLWAIADSAAQSQGGTVKAAKAVRSTRAAAVLLTSQGIIKDDQPVWVVQAEGAAEFVCNSCHHPAGSVSPRGRFITMIVGARTFQGLDFGLDATKADLSRLGPVVDLHRRRRISPGPVRVAAALSSGRGRRASRRPGIRGWRPRSQEQLRVRR